MVDKIKNVKFDFFQVKLDDKTYQFENWLDDAQKQIVSDYEKLIVVVGGDKFAIRSVSHEGKDGKYWTALFAKYRSDVPAVGKTSPTQPLDEMKLPDDEFVVEDFSILYDSTKRILMIQRNRFSSGPTYLSKYVDEIRQL